MVIDTEKMQELLKEELATVTEELKTLGVHNPDVKEDWIATPEQPAEGEADPNVVADRVEDWDERASTLALLETRYNNLNRALTKIEEGAYGTCEMCEREIEQDRLEANPAARTCKEHMNEEENLT